jgi:hypothetical protein
MPDIGEPYLQFDKFMIRDNSQFLTYSVLSWDELHPEKGTTTHFLCSAS